ncbi:hypothetical protein [Streptomyces sp. SCA2-2]|uniref:hypothetical protein n=1 Tax=Streptomyces sp. SCA2-2 TaxID=1563677 RepID=UPI0010225C14|nr:hypothetical protein [Streptomyces sp. SCA2-2]
MSRDHHFPAFARPDRPSAPDPTPEGKPPFLSQRTALISFMAVSIGVGIGLPTFFVRNHPAVAVVVGLTATAGSAKGLHSLID